MHRALIGVALLAALAAPAGAEAQYDRKLEQAIMDIVARKIGDIRGSFDYDHKPVIVEQQPAGPEAMSAAPAMVRTTRLATPEPVAESLVPATERTISPIATF